MYLYMHTSIYKKKPVLTLFIDFSSAYDKVDI